MREKHQLVSSLVVFSHLKKKQKHPFDILDSLVGFLIKNKNPQPFTHVEVCDWLNESFGFEIPRLVVESSLRRMARKYEWIVFSNKKYMVKNINNDDIVNLDHEIQEAVDDENTVLKELIDFVSSFFSNDLSETEQKIIKDDFISYFLGNTQGSYSKYVESFVIKKGKNSSIINDISNGIIVYDGLRYNNMFEDNRRWDRLNIYINMEIIFHFMGYNGDIFQKITQELFDIIRRINGKEKKLFLYYTSREKSRIEDFFDAVINNVYIQKNRASEEIVKKCGRDEIKIKNEMYKLFQKLEESSILERDLDRINYESEYNVISNQIKEENSHVSNHGEILEFLNKLSILRANHQCTIETARYIFLTEENNFIKVSNCIKQEMDQQIPLAVRIQYLTCVLWLKTGEAFSAKTPTPLIFQPDTRAKISLALELNNLGDSLHKEVEARKNELDEVNAKKMLYDIKTMNIKPEEIDENNIEHILELSGADLEYFEQRKKEHEGKICVLENENYVLKMELGIRRMEDEYGQTKDELRVVRQSIKKETRTQRLKWIFGFLFFSC